MGNQFRNFNYHLRKSSANNYHLGHDAVCSVGFYGHRQQHDLVNNYSDWWSLRLLVANCRDGFWSRDQLG